MRELLTKFLREAAAAPFAYGSWDCAMTLASWVRLQTGKDPAPHLRGAYCTSEGWQEIVLKAGGLVRLVDNLAWPAGLVRVTEPRAGDIGVVRTGWGPAGAIYADPRWVAKMIPGLIAASQARSYAIWGFR